MDNLKVKIGPNGIMPNWAHDTDVGMDLYTPIDFIVPRSVFMNKTTKEGMRVSQVVVGNYILNTEVILGIPNGIGGFIKSKSGLNFRNGIIVEGVIDPGYTGTVKLKLYNLTGTPVEFHRGDKVAQIVFVPFVKPSLEMVESFPKSERGTGGFGSTGR